MAQFIVTGNYTATAMKGMIANPTDREAAVRELIAAGGASLQQFYLTTGDTDFLAIAKADSASNVMSALMVAGASGTVANLKTVQAFSSAEFTAAQTQAGAIAASFKPAG